MTVRDIVRIGIILCPIIALAVVLGLSGTETSPGISEEAVASAEPPEISVDAAVATRRSMVRMLRTAGRVRTLRETEIVAGVEGVVLSSFVHNGSFVHKGDLLARIDDREEQLAYERSAADLLGAQSEYRTLAYLPSNRDDGVAGKSGILQARESFERAKRDLAMAGIRAPFAGFVANWTVVEGERLRPGSVAGMVVDLSRLTVDCELLDVEIGRIALGQEADVEVPGYPGRVFSGKVEMINPLVDQRSKTVVVTIALRPDRASPLRPGMYASVGIHAHEAAGSLEKCRCR
jgi:multidrug efflux pump subunit AcrA (membrane-fusion protein)